MQSLETRDKIVASLTEGKEKDEHKKFIVVGGGMQTGQAVMQRMLIDQEIVDPKKTVIIAPGAFVGMDGFAALKNVQHPEKTAKLVRDYQEIVTVAVNKALRAGYSVLLVDHAEDSHFITNLARTAKHFGYDTQLVGLSSSPESYHAYAAYTEATQQRKADHERGFDFLGAFSRNFRNLSKTFHGTTLFESKFSPNGGDVEIAIHRVADVISNGLNSPVMTIHDPETMARFIARANLRPANTVEDACLHVQKNTSLQAGNLRNLQPQAHFANVKPLQSAFNAFAERGTFTTEAALTFKKLMAKRSVKI